MCTNPINNSWTGIRLLNTTKHKSVDEK